MKCKICKFKVIPTRDEAISYCKACKHFNYRPDENSTIIDFNHEVLSDSLSKLRSRNAKLIYKKFKTLTNLNKRYVEVGAGKGFLIEKFLKDSISCTAIDMDESFQEHLTSKGIKFIKMSDKNIESLSPYDCFLSSHFLEHIEHPNKFLKMLKSSNVEYLIIEVPINNGLIFQISRILKYIGIDDFWDRLFQKSSNSPHIQYFSETSMELLLKNNSYIIEEIIRVDFIDRIPNYKRIKATESSILSLIVATILPIIDLLNRVMNKADALVYIARLEMDLTGNN